MQKKVREAEMEWIPYIVVIGDKEISQKILNVRDRYLDKTREIPFIDFIDELREKIRGKPVKRLNEDYLLSKRVKFV